MRLRIRRRAKEEALDIDRHGAFFAVVGAILDLKASLRPGGYAEVEDPEGIYWVRVRRDWRDSAWWASGREETAVA